MKYFLFFLVMMLLFSAKDVLAKDSNCEVAANSVLAAGEILFAYSTGNALDALLTFDGKNFKEANGKEFKGLAQMWNIHDQHNYAITFSAGPGKYSKCLWTAVVRQANFHHRQKEVPAQLYASQKTTLIIDIPKDLSALFYRLNTTCVDQGDWPEGQQPPCTKPTLLAYSDLNKNGQWEFWYTNPYTWNTGVAVSEIGADQKLKVLVDKCLDCD